MQTNAILLLSCELYDYEQRQEFQYFLKANLNFQHITSTFRNGK